MDLDIPRLPAVLQRAASSSETLASTAFVGSRSPDLAAPRPFTSVQRPVTETTANRREEQRPGDGGRMTAACRVAWMRSHQRSEGARRTGLKDSARSRPDRRDWTHLGRSGPIPSG